MHTSLEQSGGGYEQVPDEAPAFDPSPPIGEVGKSPLVLRIPQEKRDPTSQEMALMRLLAEQGAVWIDQLAVLLEMHISDVVQLIKESARQGWVAVDLADPAEYPHAWLRSPGVRLVDVGPDSARPNTYELPFLKAANAVRIFYMKNFPNHMWRSHELLLFDYRASRGKVPAAIVESLDSEGIIHRCALELDCDMQHLPGRKALDQIRELMDEQVLRYDSVELFTSGRFMVIAEALEKKYPTLTLRELSNFWLPLSVSPSEVWADLEACRVEERKIRKVFTENPNRRTIEVTEPVHVFEMDLEDMPAEVPRSIADEGFEESPQVLRLWKREGSGWPLYCVETEDAVYRVTYSISDTRADKVIDESLFVKRTDRKAKKIFMENPRDRARAQVTEVVEVYEMDLEDMPTEIPRIIAEGGFEERPEIVRLWKREGSGWPLYCVETEIAVYRVTYSHAIARADRVIDDESLFVKCTDRKAKKLLVENSRERARPEVGEPIEVYEMDLDDMPTEIPQIIAGDGFEEYPAVVRLWKREGSGWPLYCVETEEAVYRVIYSGSTARADRVIDESLFIKRTDRKAKKRFTENPNKPLPEVHEGTEVYEMDLEDMPAEVPEAIADEGFEEHPVVVGLWKQSGGGTRAYCAQTEAAVYRVVRSSYGWRADKVIDESLFVKCGKLPERRVFTENPTKAPPEVHAGTEVFDADLSAMPPEVPAAIASEGFEGAPQVIGLWKQHGGGSQIYCVQTKAAVYRVVRSSSGWRADKVIDESLFVKCGKRRPYHKPIILKRRWIAYRFDPDALPPEAAEKVAEYLGLAYLPRFKAAWKKYKGGTSRIFCVETDRGFFRLSRTRHGWRVDPVDPDVAFDRRDEPPPLAPTSGEPTRFLIAVYSHPLAETPPEVPQTIAEIRDPLKPSHISAIWRKAGSYAEVYCVKTDVGIYRVDHSLEYGWSAFRVSGDVFLKLPPKRPSIRITDPEQMKVSDQLWSKLVPLLPAESDKPGTHPNRAVLNTILYRVYTETKSWKKLPLAGGLPGGSARGRLRRWQEEGIWEPIRKILEEELPEGRALNWALVEPGSHRLPLHRVIQL